MGGAGLDNGEMVGSVTRKDKKKSNNMYTMRYVQSISGEWLRLC